MAWLIGMRSMVWLMVMISGATVPAEVMLMGATRLLDTIPHGALIGTRWGYVRNIT